MFYLISIDENGTPGRLFGPETFEELQAKMRTFVKRELERMGEEFTEEDETAIELGGIYEFDDGGGWYIMQAE